MAIADIEPLDPKGLDLSLDGFGDLHVKLSDGTEHAGTTALRAFPFTAPGRYITLSGADGTEIGIIDDISELDRQSLRAVREELEKSYFMPRIVRVNDIDEDFGVPKWDVETDRGPRKFQLKSRRDSRLVGAGRVLITDIDGNRYEVPDYRKLDARSEAFIEEEV